MTYSLAHQSLGYLIIIAIISMIVIGIGVFFFDRKELYSMIGSILIYVGAGVMLIDMIIVLILYLTVFIYYH